MATSLQILVVSDGTAASAEVVAAAVLAQFDGVATDVVRFPFTRSEEQVGEIIGRASAGTSVVVSACASAETRALLLEHARAAGVPAVDILEPMMEAFSEVLERAPEPALGRLRRHHDELLQLADAIEFTLAHDDGRGLDGLREADLIILGLSRAGKTPTSIYLSSRKLRVANVPIVQDLPLPPQVRQSPAAKVGFRTTLERQLRLRTERTGRLGGGIPGYADERSILAELEYCERVFRSLPGLQTIDVSSRSVEEISDWIVRNVLGGSEP
jgi:regulator of PEP synthase PpsR (kinase-PPPase family)